MLTHVVQLEEIGTGDVEQVGGKAANLGELIRGGLPVPGGFVVTAQAFLAALDEAGVRQTVRQRLAAVDVDDPVALSAAAHELQGLVRSAPLPDTLFKELLHAYHDLGDNVSVAVRSSATSEDSSDTSFAGMNATFTNVCGDDQLVERVRDCWASLYASRVVAYRASKHVDVEPALAVVVQRMVDADRAGVLFTADPSTADPDRIVVEAAFGLGEVVVGGKVEPDTYVVDKADLRLVSVRVGHKDFEVVRGADGQDARVELPQERAGERVLSDDEVIELARTGLRIHAQFGTPQDVEWAYAGGRLAIVQSRPITTMIGPRAAASARPAAAGAPAAPDSSGAAVLLSGLAASPGRVSGAVRILTSPDQGATLQRGEILVAPMTSPDWVPTIRRAAALVTDGGGMTCHAAIVARELGVPCVVGTRRATTVLHDGQIVTVDGTARPGRGRCAAAAGGHGRGPGSRRRPDGRGGAATVGDARSTSTWPSPTTPRRSRRCRSTVSDCSGRSSC